MKVARFGGSQIDAGLDWVHWFNENRLHSSIGYLTPIEIEEHYREMNPHRQPPMGELALH